MPLNRLSHCATHISCLKTRLRHEEGATLVEFGISVGIFLMVTIGVIYLCMALYAYEYVDFAAREGARYAIVRGSECYLSSSMPGCDSSATETTTEMNQSVTDIQNYVTGLSYPIIDPSQLTVGVSWYSYYFDTSTTPSSGNWKACTISSPPTDTECNQPGNAVQVTASYPISFNIPFFGSFAPTVSSSSQMVISQ